MKFAHIFQDHLTKDGFPQHWVDSAISYRQLKKCIKRVEEELTALGLDADTLTALLKSVEKGTTSSTHEEEENKPFEYRLSRASSSAPSPPTATLNTPPSRRPRSSSSPQFVPHLLFAVDERTGQPLDARLAPETKAYLHELAVRQGLTDVRVLDTSATTASAASSRTSSTSPSWRNGTDAAPAIRMVSVPLHSDTLFFAQLWRELSGLASLQAAEQSELFSAVAALRDKVAKVADPARGGGKLLGKKLAMHKSDLPVWQRIFASYVEREVFFATGEVEHGARGYEEARRRFEGWVADLKREGLPATRGFKRKESADALALFVALNRRLLANLLFMDLNRAATAKILKKFDKRTALGARPGYDVGALLARDVTQAVCAAVAQELLPAVPQLTDWLCPVCYAVAYRPIRLRCKHLFCIRCVVVMQRTRTARCPLCRETCVLEADTSTIDWELGRWLKMYFPKEVHAKHKDNLRQNSVEEYGEEYIDKCVVM
ncbi:SPX domain-containing protein [Lineolata rhizophorae]|uniref:SPX domain-containing protein n=1 Tax=Lineolata rhizophorae TaxID=578093 RepID=A0A6A6P6H6_9PEZI|nr:SPX domain-containing protein [Lineolata rhizophorae]